MYKYLRTYVSISNDICSKIICSFAQWRGRHECDAYIILLIILLLVICTLICAFTRMFSSEILFTNIENEAAHQYIGHATVTTVRKHDWISGGQNNLVWPREVEAEIHANSCLKESLHVLLWGYWNYQSKSELQIFAKLCGQNSNSNIHIVVCFGLGGSPSSN